MRSTAGLQPSTATVSGPARDARAGPLLASAAAAIDVPTDVILILVTPRGRGCGGGRCVRRVARQALPHEPGQPRRARPEPRARTRNVVRSHRLAAHARLGDVGGTRAHDAQRRGRRDTLTSPTGHTVHAAWSGVITPRDRFSRNDLRV